MEKFIHDYIIKDRKIVPICKIQISNYTIIYEVLRVIDAVPLFIEKHLERLNLSAKLCGKTIRYHEFEFIELISKLIQSNKASIGNIKIILSFNDHLSEQECIIGFIEHSYPQIYDYENGVKIISTEFKRDTPNAKVQATSIRDKMNLMMVSGNAFEVLYIHPDGYFTECSRSNIFFIRDNKLYTAPDEDVLAGITRNCIIDIIHTLNLTLEFKRLSINEIQSIESAFITGTSPKVLPVKLIDSITLNPKNLLLHQISVYYDHLISQYLLSHQIFN
jgi:branched-chain amino acid aminotransferase